MRQQETFAEYQARLRREAEGDPADRAVVTLDALRSINPDLAAVVQRGRGDGPAVYDEAARYEAEATERLRSWRETLGVSPRTAMFLSDPANAVVAHEDVEQLGFLEELLGAREGSGYSTMDQLRWTGDAGRRLAGGAVGLLGTAARGFARLGEVGARTGPGVYTPGVGVAASLLDRWGVFRELRRFGEAADLMAADIGGTREESAFGYFAPAEDTGFVGDVMEGVGQLGGQVLVHTATGGVLTAPVLFAQGVGQADQQQEEAGTASRPGADASAMGAGIVVAGLERLQVWNLIERAPAPIRNEIMRRIAEVGISVISEGTQEAAEQIAMNALNTLLVDPTAPILEGVAESGAVGGGVGGVVGVMRALAVSSVPGRGIETRRWEADQAARAADRLSEAVERVAEVPLAQRSPEHMRAFLGDVAGDEDVFIPAAVVTQYLQSAPNGQALAESWGITAQLAEARGTDADIVLPVASYLMIGPEAHAAFVEDVRIGALPSRRESSAPEWIGEAEAEAEGAVETIAQTEAAAEARGRVHADLLAQATAAGRDPEAARQYADLWARTYESFASRNPEVYPDAWAAYQAMPLEIRSEGLAAPTPTPRPTAPQQRYVSRDAGAMRPHIAGAASEFGVSEDFLTVLASRESGFRPTVGASTSSAQGLYQFINTTWMNTLRAHPELGVDVDSMSEADALALRNDPQLAARAAALLTRDNAQALTRGLGRTPTGAELYTAHFLGPNAAIRFAQAEPTAPAHALFPRAAAANRSIFYDNGRPRTVAEVRSILGRGFDGADPVGAGGVMPAPASSVGAEVQVDPIFGGRDTESVAEMVERVRAGDSVPNATEILEAARATGLPETVSAREIAERIMENEALPPLPTQPDGTLNQGAVEQQAQTVARTPEFREWFGPSVVTTPEGEPLVVYHGTNATFDAFDPAKVGSAYGTDDQGFFFTSSEREADLWAERAPNAQTPRVMPVYLSMAKPWIVDAPEGRGPVEYFESGEGVFNRGHQAAIAYGISSGYDGMIVRGAKETLYVAFDPTQIKSIFNPRPSRDNPSIMGQGPFDRFAPENVARDRDAMIETVTAFAAEQGVALTLEPLPRGYASQVRIAKFAGVTAEPDAAVIAVAERLLAEADKAEMSLHVSPSAETARGFYVERGFISTGRNRMVRYPAPDEAWLGEDGQTFGQSLLDGDMPVFFSALRRAVEGSTLKEGSPQQWRGILVENAREVRSARRDPETNKPALDEQGQPIIDVREIPMSPKGGLKMEEIEWTGVLDWLELDASRPGEGRQGKITREELLEYIDGNGVDVRVEVNKKTGADEDAIEERADEILDEMWERARDYVEYNNYPTDIEEEVETEDGGIETVTRYAHMSDGQIIGTYDTEEEAQEAADEANAEDEVYYEESFRDDYGHRREAEARAREELGGEDDTSWSEYAHGGSEEYMELSFVLGTKGEAHARQGGDFDSGHSGFERNSVAHARADLRRDDTGALVLHVVEIQDDWGAQGEKHGYRRDPDPAEVERTRQAYEERQREAQAAYEALWNLALPVVSATIAPVREARIRTEGELRVAGAALADMIDDPAVPIFTGDTVLAGSLRGEKAKPYEISSWAADVSYRLGRLVGDDHPAVVEAERLSRHATNASRSYGDPDTRDLERQFADAEAADRGPLVNYWTREAALKVVKRERPDLAERIDELVALEERASLLANEADNEARRALNPQGVPDRPFKGDNAYSALVLKALIRFAAARGVQKVSWIHGHQQNGGKTAQRIGNLRIYALDETRTVVKSVYGSGPVADVFDERSDADGGFTQPQLAELLGASLAAQIHEQAREEGVSAQNTKEFNTRNAMLNQGGWFYDKLLINVANSLIKKYGARVGTVSFGGAAGQLKHALAGIEEARAREIPPVDPDVAAMSDAEWDATYTSLYRSRSAIVQAAVDAAARPFMEPGASSVGMTEAMGAAAQAAASTPEVVALDTERERLKARNLRDARDTALRQFEQQAAVTRFGEPERLGLQHGFEITPELAAAASGGFTLFQRREDQAQEQPLYVVHNLSAEKLRHADSLGGLAAPSLAVARGDIGFDDFGEISLIGDPSMADPRSKGVRAFGADVYSPRQPRARHRIDATALRALKAKVQPVAERLGIDIRFDETSVERDGLSALMGEAAVKAAWLETVGEEVPVRFREVEPPARVRGFEQFTSEDVYELVEDEGFIAALRDYYEAVASHYTDQPDMLERVNSAWLGEDGELSGEQISNFAGRVARANKSVRAFGEGRPASEEVDRYLTSRAIDEQIGDRISDFDAWIEAEFGGVVTALFFETDAGRKKDYTLTNIVREMTREVRNGESFNYGAASVRAAVTPEFRSLGAIKEARGSIVSDEAFKALKDEVNAELFELADQFAPYHASGKDFGWGDIFSEFLKDLAGPPRLLAEWQGEIFSDPVPDELLDQAREFLEKLRGLPTGYFEIKMQRAVDLSEFRAAVIPSDAKANTRAILERAGLKIVEYDADLVSGADMAAARLQAVQSLSEEAFFQDDTAPGDRRGQVTFRNGKALVELFRTRDRSTLLHEGGHIFLENLAATAQHPKASEATKADFAAVMKWMGISSWDQVTVEHHEAWAEAFEAYLQEGRSPSLALRNAFKAFARWLTDIYRTARAQRIPISDEIRGVMDRLVATDEEIAEARKVSGLDPLFDTAEAAGMTEAEFAAYSRLTAKAKATAEDRMLRRMMAAVRRERTQLWKDEAEALRPEITEEIDAQPAMMALALVTSGGRRINQAMAEQMGGVTGLPKRVPPVYSPEGEHPDALAEAAGFETGGQMLDALRALETERQASKAAGDSRSVRTKRIEDLTAERLHERHGDLWSDESIREAAQEALHTGQQAEVLATETRVLARRAKKDMVPQTILETWAKRQIAMRPVAQVKPGKYLEAERRAAKAAIKALEEGNFSEAFTQKQKQLVNHLMWAEARRAKEVVTKAEKLFARILKAKDSKARDWNMVQAAQAILAGFGYARKGSSPLEYLELVREYDLEAYEALKPQVDAAVAKARPPEELPFDDFEGLRDVVDQLWSMSRIAKEVEVEGERFATELLAGQLVAELGGIDGKGPGREGAVTEGERAKMQTLGALASLRKVEEWAMRRGPAFHRYIFKPVSKAADAYRLARIGTLAKLDAALRTLEEDWKSPRLISAPELGGYVFGRNGGNGVAEIIGAMRHLGNESNRRKLLLGGRGQGRAWATQDEFGEVDTSRWDAFMARMHKEGVIQKRHWDYVQAEWDLHEEIKPQAQKAHKALYGRYFAEVTAEPVRTPFGTYAGGYVMAKADPFLNTDAMAREAEALLKGDVSGSFSFPGPANGFTKARTTVNRPLDLDLRQAIGQMDTVLKFAYLGPAVRAVNRVLMHPQLKEALNAYDPVAWDSMLLPWLRRSVAQRLSAPPSNKAEAFANKWVGTIGQRASGLIMFANVVNVAQQITGIPLATVRTGKRNMLFALGQYLSDPRGQTERIRALSPMMRARADQSMADLIEVSDDLVLNPNLYQKAQDFSSRHTYFMQLAFQKVLDPIVWQAAYNRAVESKDPNPEGYADMVVRTTQDSRNAEDVAAWSSGPAWAGPLKAFTGYFMSWGGVLHTEFSNAGSVQRRLEVYLLGFFIPTILAKLIGDGLRGRLEDDEDDGWLDELFDILVVSQIQTALAFIPLVGQAANTALAAFNDKPFDDRMSFPIMSLIEEAAGSGRDVADAATGEGDASQTTKSVLTLLGLSTGLPTMPRNAGLAADVIEGEVEPTGPIDAVRAGVTGSASPESRS